MADSVRCPSCGVVWEIAELAQAAELTCPQCQTKVPNPDRRRQLPQDVMLARPTRPGGFGEVTVPPEPLAQPLEQLAKSPTDMSGGERHLATTPTISQTSNTAPITVTQRDSPGECPKCGQSVQEGWRYCPYCNAELAAPKPPSDAPGQPTQHRRQGSGEEQPLEAEVVKETKSDLVLSGWGSVGLQCILVIVVIALFISGEPSWGLLAVVLAVVIATILALRQGQANQVRSPANLPQPHKPTTRSGAATAVGSGAVGVAGGCAIGALITALVAFLMFMSLLAAIGNAINTCLTCGQGPPAKQAPGKTTPYKGTTEKTR